MKRKHIDKLCIVNSSSDKRAGNGAQEANAVVL